MRYILLTGLCFVAGLAQAADNGIYVGAGVVQSEYGLSNPGGALPFDSKDNGYKLIVGWRPLDSFGVEATYMDHGYATVPSGIVCLQFSILPCPTATSLAAETMSAFAVGYLDLPFVDLFVKAGVNSWNFKGQSIGPFVPVYRINESGTDLAFGAGVQVRFSSLGARLEYERFYIVKDEHLDAISLSLTYTFL